MHEKNSGLKGIKRERKEHCSAACPKQSRHLENGNFFNTIASLLFL